MRRVRVLLLCGAALLLLLLGVGPLVAELLHGWPKFVPLAVVALVTIALARLQILDRPTGLPRLLEHVGRNKLEALAASRGLTEKVARVEIGVASGYRFEVLPPAPAQISSGPVDLLTPLSTGTNRRKLRRRRPPQPWVYEEKDRV